MQISQSVELYTMCANPYLFYNFFRFFFQAKYCKLFFKKPYSFGRIFNKTSIKTLTSYVKNKIIKLQAEK